MDMVFTDMAIMARADLAGNEVRHMDIVKAQEVHVVMDKFHFVAGNDQVFQKGRSSQEYPAVQESREAPSVQQERHLP